MERKSTWKSSLKSALAGVLVFGVILMGLPGTVTEAGVVFTRGAKKADNDGYPESRFGQAPEQPLGAVERRRDADRNGANGGGFRAPAGLEFSGSEGARPAPRDTGRSAGMMAAELPAPEIMTEPSPSSGTPADLIPNKTKGVQEVALIAGDLGFFPNTVFVTRDIPVRMFVTGASGDTLCIMMDSFHVRKQVRTNEIEEITFTPTIPGKYRFYCPVNGMEGTMVVRELASRGTGD